MNLFTKDLLVSFGVVPATCSLSGVGPVAAVERAQGRSPCARCNHNRAECKGAPRGTMLSERQREDLARGDTVFSLLRKHPPKRDADQTSGSES